jgi:hypothetical protein
MATTAIHRLTLDPMGKCSNAFFSETTNIIKANTATFVTDNQAIIFRAQKQNTVLLSAIE